ncbi:MAG: hypothetical protein EZS28_042517, partial [Streblomastix strix]
MKGATITEKEDAGNRTTISERRTARNTQNRIFDDQHRRKEKRQSRVEHRTEW